MVNEKLYKLCRLFIEKSISTLDGKIKAGYTVPQYRPFVRTFNENGGVTATGSGQPINEYSDFIFSFRNDLYNLKEAIDLVDYLLDSKLIPSTVNETKEKENAKTSIKYNYLGSFLTEYVRRVEDINFSETKFNELYNEFEESFSSSASRYIAIAPLYGFDSEVPEIDLTENLKIKKITEKEFNNLQRLVNNRINPFANDSFPIQKILNIKYLIECEYEAPRNTFGGASTNNFILRFCSVVNIIESFNSNIKKFVLI